MSHKSASRLYGFTYLFGTCNSNNEHFDGLHVLDITLSLIKEQSSNWTSANLVFGKIDSSHTFKVSSQMSEGGVIFSDGVKSDYLEFNSGIEAIVRIADKKGLLVI